MLNASQPLTPSLCPISSQRRINFAVAAGLVRGRCPMDRFRHEENGRELPRKQNILHSFTLWVAKSTFVAGASGCPFLVHVWSAVGSAGNKRTMNSRNSLCQITILSKRARISSSHLHLSFSLSLPDDGLHYAFCCQIMKNGG